MTMGSESEYSSVEQERIAEFRKHIQDIIQNDAEKSDDSFLIRWLRARNLDVKKAEEMIRNSMEWREANQVDGIIEREPVPQELANEAPFAICGNTSEGLPIFLCPMGRHDMRKFIEMYGKERCERINITNMEKITQLLKDAGKEQGKVITQFVEIIDFEGYSYKQMSSKLCRDFMVEQQKVMDAHYPEILKHAVLVNAPKVFTILFAMLKPFIPKHTLDKVEIYGPDKSKWQKIIAEKYPMSKVPPHWGGTLKGVDEYCSGHEIWIQGPSDLAAFMNGTSSEAVKDEADLIRVTINARDKIVKELQVKEKGSVIEWKFKTEGYDIGFNMTFGNFNDGENEATDLIEYVRLDSHKALQRGSHTCEKPGVYRIIFDNSFSLMKSKILKYDISLIIPEVEFQNCVEFQ